MTTNNWQPRRGIERAYNKALRGMLKCFQNLIEGLDITDPHEILEALRKYVTTDFFQGLANSAARKMVTGLYHDGAKTWREAARKSTRGRQIYEALLRELQGPMGVRVNHLVRENAQLISTFPESIASQVNRFITEEAYKGRRAEFVAQDLRKQFPDITKGRLHLIARTETAKANTALSQARAEYLDLDWYIWRTSHDARVRDSHHLMEGVLVNWNYPPNPEQLDKEPKITHGPYHAGNIYNCRCFPETVLDLEQVDWPAKVFWAGRIQRMTRAQFGRIGGLRNAA
jgi:SPP1 gp7 family putative phage head morphogenesis protein